MPVIQDRDVDANSAFVERDIVFQRSGATAAAFNATIGKVLLGKAFEVKRVTAWAAAGSAGARIDVKVNGVSILTATQLPTYGAVAPAVATLVAQASRRGTNAHALEVVASTEASTGNYTDLYVVVTVRYRAHRGDPGTV